MKDFLQKSDDPYLALLEFRSTPIEGIGLSPSQLLMSRRIKSILPTANKLLYPEVHQGVQQRLAERQAKQKPHYNKTAHPLPDLEIGDSVRYKSGTWNPATITEKLPYRSYKILTPDGCTYRRNRVLLRATKEKSTTGELCNGNSTETEEDLDGENTQAEPGPDTLQDTSMTTTRSGRISKKPNRLNL